MKMDSSRLLEFAQRYTTAWCSQDPRCVASFFSPNGSLCVNDSNPAVGRTAITEFTRGFMSTFPDLHLTMGDIFIREDHSVYHWTLEGTNTGTGGTGHRVRISGFEVWEFDADGLIAKSRGHFDEAEYRHQLQTGFQASD
jgi:uncharacterized protein (TIGR02246 family)